MDSPSVWLAHPLFLPVGASGLSALILLISTISSAVDEQSFMDPATTHTRFPSTAALQDEPHRLYIHAPSLIRIVGCLILLGLFASNVAADPRDGHVPMVALGTCIAFGYIACLSLFVPLMSPNSRRRTEQHIEVLLLFFWIMHINQHLWPRLRSSIPPPHEDNYVLEVIVLTTIAVVVPLLSPREYVPLDPHDIQKPSQEQVASPLSQWTYTFMNSLISLSQDHSKLTTDQLPPLADYDRSGVLTKDSFPILNPEGKAKQYLFWGFLRVFKWDYVCMAILYIGQMLLALVSPAAISRLLGFMETGKDPNNLPPWFWIVCLFLGPFMRAIILQRYAYMASRVMVRSEAILTQLIFSQALQLRVDSSNSSTERKANLTGKINNLATSDLLNITSFTEAWLIMLLAPVQIGTSIFFLYKVLSWSALVGTVVMILCLPVPGYLTRLIRGYGRAKMKMTDARVQVVTETINSLRMMKLFGWEDRASKRIDAIREAELSLHKKFKLMELMVANFNFFIPLLTMMTTYATYTLVMRRPLTASAVFSSIAVFELLRLHLRQVSNTIPTAVQGKISLDRLDDFLNDSEMKLEVPDQEQPPELLLSNGARYTPFEEVGFGDMSFSWSKDHKAPFRLMIRGSMVFGHGLNLIAGPTASGKTSLLLALLGEMYSQPAGPRPWMSLPRAQGVAYVSQEPWILNDTIKENITFGSHFDHERFWKVIYQCCLQHDLARFDAREATEVGERGLTLSGGQKARIALARAVYSEANIILLDDTLAALDIKTAKTIVKECLRGDLMKDRIVLLVTHNLTLTSHFAKTLTTLNANGVAIQGPIPSIPTNARGRGTKSEVDAPGLDERTTLQNFVGQSTAYSGKLIDAEEVEEGHIDKSAFKLYVKYLSQYPIIFWTIVMSTVLLNESNIAFQSWFLGYWASRYETMPVESVPVISYLSIYAVLLFFSLAMYSTMYIFFTVGSIRASRVLHRLLIKSVLETTWRWLDTTPISRVITRVTQDMNAIDGPLAFWMRRVLDNSTAMFTRLVAIVYTSPLFLFPGLGVAVLGWSLGQYYMKAQLAVKRELSNARAPVLGHLSVALSGLVSIRAYGAQERFMNKSLQHIDRYTRAAFAYNHLNRWISVRSDALGGLFTASLGAYLVYVKAGESTAAQTGFSLSMAVAFSTMILTGVRIYNNVELNGNSLERVLQYIKIKPESGYAQQSRPPAYWPASGELVVQELSARYSETGPEVLRNISFRIKSGEHVGIVGRTGSGKSSLILALLRCIPTEGHIYLDGIPTDSVNLSSLRSKITVIPQDPELLSGTLRYNLDPFSEHDDAFLNDVLRSAGLDSVYEDVDDPTGNGRLSLDSVLTQGGRNLSVGQRQIIALARALARGSKVLILDEDYKTDTAIQRTLRNELKDITLITVAHRLQTIMDFDKIMVLHDGCIVEFGEPSVLFQSPGGMLKAMVDESPNRGVLVDMAMRRRKDIGRSGRT
ncbi:hypothetical protein AX16_005387 [Volvariella volvacea WC 439]|nr:hypothetical protein AX16_005387 [Volvariella volvacea WC 439]